MQDNEGNVTGLELFKIPAGAKVISSGQFSMNTWRVVYDLHGELHTTDVDLLDLSVKHGRG